VVTKHLIRVGITKNRTVEFSLRQIGEMVNVDKSNVRRALLRLAPAGLVVVHRQLRRRLKVTIVEWTQVVESA
jgi:predicted transcriptional regulator